MIRFPRTRTEALSTVAILACVVAILTTSCMSDSEWSRSAKEADAARQRIMVGMSRAEVKDVMSDAWHYDMCSAIEDLFFFGSHDTMKAGVVRVQYYVTDENGNRVASTEKEMKPGWHARVESA